jgi:DinB superfamily
MGELDRLRERVEAARREYAALSREGWGEPGPVDEQTGERWDRGNVLGHVAEMLPYWTGQVRAVLEGAEAIGRDEVGYAQRRMGIDSGREAGEEGLLARIDAGMESLLALLAELDDADLERRVLGRSPRGDREATLGELLTQLLVEHLEEHLRQIRALQDQPSG